MEDRGEDDVLNFIDSDRKAAEDPDLHFKKLKAKIKLKVVKKYQEDLEKKQLEEQKALEPVIVVKDRFGRIMEKKHPLLNSKKVPNANRKPIKVPPLKRKMSFSTCQLEYHDCLEMKNHLENGGKPTMMELETIKDMKKANRFPIPESLMGKPQKGKFRLTMDSIIREVYTQAYVEEWADYKPDVEVPYNSMESEDEF